jgi:hypothetical protein
MKSPSIPPGKTNLRAQFFKASRLAVALAITGGLFFAAAAQGAQAVITDLGTNGSTQIYIAPTPGPNDIYHLGYDQAIQVGSGNSYHVGTTGFGYSWNNNNISPGETFTTGSDPSELTSVALKFFGPGSYGNNSGVPVTEPFTLTIYQIYTTVVGANTITNCSVVTCYTATGAITNVGDWLQWTGLAVDLLPNTTYAYGFCEASSSTAGNNWDVLAVDTNNPNVFNPSQTIAQFPDAGGLVDYGAATTTNYTAVFDIGLTVPPAGAPVPNTPAVYSPAQALPVAYGIVQGSTAVPQTTNLTLVAAVGGAQPITYQWLQAGPGKKLTNIVGATGSTLLVNTFTIPSGNSNSYAYVAYNSVSNTVGVTSAVEWLVAAWPSMVDLGQLASWQGGGAAPPTVGTYDISQMSTATNQYTNTGITMRDDGGFENGLWPAQTFTTPAAVITNVTTTIHTNIVTGVSTNYTTNYSTNYNNFSGWQATTLTVKTGGGGNFVLDGGWGTGFVIAGNLYDVAFYALSGAGNTNATMIAGPLRYFGKGTENDWMQFTGLGVDLAPATTYAFVWDLDGANTTLSSGQTTDIYENIWIAGPNPTITGGGVGGGQIAVIKDPNGQTGVANQTIPSQGAVIYNSPANTYDMTFDLGLSALPQPVIFTPTWTPTFSPIYAATQITFTEPAVSYGAATYQWLTDSGAGAIPPVLSNIPGANSSTLHVDTTGYAPGAYNYQVIVANSAGSSTSSVVTLQISAASPPNAVTHPAGAYEVYVGQPVTMPSSWNGTYPIYYQWYFNSTNPAIGFGPMDTVANPTAASSTLVLSNPQFSDVGTYTVTANNSQDIGGEVLGGNATLNVLPLPPSLSSTPFGTTVQSQSPYAFWALNETNDATAGDLPAYDNTGHGYIGVYGTDAQKGLGPQYPGFAANSAALTTVAGDVSSFVTLPPINLNSSSVTMTMWINPPTNVQVNAGLLMYRNGSTDASGFCFGNGANAAGMAGLGYNWNNVATTYNWWSGLYPQTNVWSFVALVIQPTQATIYLCYLDTNLNTTNIYYAVNAVTNGPDAAAFGQGGTFVIGDDSNNLTNRLFNGSIADVAVYSAALTPAQIMAQFGAGLAANAALPFAPTISGAPNSGAGYVGEGVPLSVVGALGTPTITYQWQLDSTNISNGANYSGVNSTTLTINNFQAIDVGSYTLIAQNGVGSVTSSPGVLNLLSPHLIGQWLSGPTSFADQSGHLPAHNGVLVSSNTAGWSLDTPFSAPGQSLNFSNGTCALAITNTASGDVGYDNTFDSTVVQDAFTVMLWAKGMPGSWNPWVSKWGETTTVQGGWQLREYGGGNGNEACFTVRDNGAGFETLGLDGGDDMATSVNSNDGQWHHYAGTFDSVASVRNLYVDGVLAAQETGQFPSVLAPEEHIVIGGKDTYTNSAAARPVYGNYFTGKIYDVRVYDYALTMPEVAAKIGTDYGTPVLLNSNIAVTTNSTAGKGYYGGKFVLTFSAKTLLESTNINGPWSVVAGATSPYTNIMTNSQLFFQLENP